MPAAAVIPAPIAYIKVVAVKKLVVGFQSLCIRSALSSVYFVCGSPYWIFTIILHWVVVSALGRFARRVWGLRCGLLMGNCQEFCLGNFRLVGFQFIYFE